MRPRFRRHVETHRRALWQMGTSHPAFSPASFAAPSLPLGIAPSRLSPPLVTVVSPWRPHSWIYVAQPVVSFYNSSFRARRAQNVLSPECPLPASSTTIRNHVNILKHTLCMEEDSENPGSYLVAFSFDADMAGSLHVCFLARVETVTDCRIIPWLPDVHGPMQVSFDKGHGQKFRQASGMGIYLHAFDAKLVEDEGPEMVCPLVILAHTDVPNLMHEGNADEAQQHHLNVQLTQAALRKKASGHYEVRVLRQIILVDGVQYGLHDLYGADGDAISSQKECVICLSKPHNIALMPCRHMCICDLCATILTTKAARCPLCRQDVQGLVRVNVGG